jgi:hypothetical protein
MVRSLSGIYLLTTYLGFKNTSYSTKIYITIYPAALIINTSMSLSSLFVGFLLSLLERKLTFILLLPVNKID